MTERGGLQTGDCPTIWVIYFLCTLHSATWHMTSGVLFANSYAFVGYDLPCPRVLETHFRSLSYYYNILSSGRLHTVLLGSPSTSRATPIRCLQLNARLV